MEDSSGGTARQESDTNFAGSLTSKPSPRVSTINTTDALIVGGGPAGLAAAIALRQRGIDCVVVEARAPGIDKACGEGLMPDALESLRSLGVNITLADGHAFRGIRFCNPIHSVVAPFPAGVGIGVRRPDLHHALAASAEAAGAHLLWNSHVELPAQPANASGQSSQTAIVNGEPLTFRWLIGADGQASSVRRWAGLDRARKESIRFGFRTHYRVAPSFFKGDFVEVHWASSGQLYITPVAPDCVCVVFIARSGRRNRDNILAGFPEVAARLAHAEPISQQRGAVSATRKLYRVANGTTALIGDASGSADCITGEGLSMSFPPCPRGCRRDCFRVTRALRPCS